MRKKKLLVKENTIVNQRKFSEPRFEEIERKLKEQKYEGNEDFGEEEEEEPYPEIIQVPSDDESEEED